MQMLLYMICIVMSVAEFHLQVPEILDSPAFHLFYQLCFIFKKNAFLRIIKGLYGIEAHTL